MEAGRTGRDAGYVELRSGAQQPIRAEGAARGIGDDRATLLEAQRRGRQVVGRVVDDAAAADAGELLPHAGDLRHHAGAGLDVRVELTGEDAREVEGRRAQVEDAAPERRAVDQLADHVDHGARRAAREAVDPEQALDVHVGTQGDRLRRAAALAARGREPLAAL